MVYGRIIVAYSHRRNAVPRRWWRGARGKARRHLVLISWLLSPKIMAIERKSAPNNLTRASSSAMARERGKLINDEGGGGGVNQRSLAKCGVRRNVARHRPLLRVAIGIIEPYIARIMPKQSRNRSGPPAVTAPIVSNCKPRPSGAKRHKTSTNTSRGKN